MDSTVDLEGSGNTLYDATEVDTHHYTLFKPIQCTSPQVNPHVNYGLRVVMMCQCSFTKCNNCTPLVGNVSDSRGCARGGAGVYEVSLYMPGKFAVNLKLL